MTVLLRYVLNGLFIILNLMINNFFNDINNQKTCPIKKDWKIENGILISNVLFLCGIINIFIPLNKYITNIPIVGGWYVYIFMIVLFVELYLVLFTVENLNKIGKKCSKDKIKIIYNLFKDKNMLSCLYFTIASSIVLFYFQ